MDEQRPQTEGGVRDLYALLKRRGYLWPSFEIYGGVAGFYDLGPLGSLLRENVEALWRSKFVLEEGFQLVDCPNITPEIVFFHSGHLDKFSDVMVSCLECSRPFRADHLLEGGPGTDPALIARLFRDRGIVCPDCGGALSEPEEFNLMFSTRIGPGSDKRGYLRPETAQNIFINFSNLYRHARSRLPFGAAQIGRGFRNEISPRQGLVRLREFHMAEGEFFFDPLVEGFAPFSRYRDTMVNLVPASSPDATLRMDLGTAVEDGTITSEVLAHFMGATASFATSLGIAQERTRFRQHLPSEMAHYARDCWDLEISTSYGWVEMVGIADRSAYDLTQHSKGSGTDLSAFRRFDEPKVIEGTRLVPDMKVLGPIFRGRAREAGEIISSMDPSSAGSAIGEGIRIEIDGQHYDVPDNAYRIESFRDVVHQERFVPNVIEPSFGMDRLMFAILEHSYFEDPNRAEEGESGKVEPYRILRLDPGIAPVKCGVFPLLNREDLSRIARDLDADLRRQGLQTNYDASDSIGRRYARMDEIGTPFCATVDHDSLKDGCATIRERDTQMQKRIPLKDIPAIVKRMVGGEKTFSDM
ncbi:MAG: glycine--tRNA ligase [Candidatus Thermoplasmatota archaeon]|nr:glycine--tRNA ligase [Candidatus Thermoplasmatota archaeon]